MPSGRARRRRRPGRVLAGLAPTVVVALVVRGGRGLVLDPAEPGSRAPIGQLSA
jgi:hypothetical protein